MFINNKYIYLRYLPGRHSKQTVWCTLTIVSIRLLVFYVELLNNYNKNVALLKALFSVSTGTLAYTCEDRLLWEVDKLKTYSNRLVLKKKN